MEYITLKLATESVLTQVTGKTKYFDSKAATEYPQHKAVTTETFYIHIKNPNI